MNIQVKNIDIDEAGCGQAIAFTALLTVNDRVVALLRDQGKGAGIEVMPLRPADGPLLGQVARCCALHYTLRPTVIDPSDPSYHRQSALQHFVEHQVYQCIQRRMIWRLDAQLAAAMEKAIVYGRLDGDLRYHPLHASIDYLLTSTQGSRILEQALKGIVPYLQPGEYVINQNIPFFLLMAMLQ
ncbi:hypothetical protein [Chitinophaga filiformis]|uniref:Uncharacterized protein n=1 Tax=Chitinophaga filiformis TaxID=104663 RepID=A0ABY4I029_CHIFI|nr:hypothetical protein [Chitinophaga filiformis]UPK68041.1 hypothetical protein MYF79_24110 [Chitinophaga filiformis]